MGETEIKRRALVFAHGSRGDVQPIIALCTRLQQRGFAVLVIANSNHAAFLTSFGIESEPILIDSDAVIREDPVMKEALATGDFGKVMASVNEHEFESYDEVTTKINDIVQRFDPALLITCPLAVTHTFVAMLHRLPVVFLQLSGVNIPTRHVKSYLNEPICHYSAYLLMNFMYFSSSVKAWIERFQCLFESQIKEKNAELPSSFEAFMYQVMHPISPSLIPISEHFVQPPSDWPEYVCAGQKFTGFWPINAKDQELHAQSQDQSFGGDSCPRLQQFLQAGEPPVYIGWGSMLAISSVHMTCLAVRTLQQTGLRGVILGGWAHLSPEDLTGQPDERELKDYIQKNILFMDSAPHEWLFPQCLILVHHGGLGTVATGLRSGRPQVVTPFVLDQFRNAERVELCGCGTSTKQFKEVTVQDLSTAITHCINSKSLMDKCDIMGKRVCQEDGVGTAVDVIEKFLAEDVATGLWQTRFQQSQKETRVRNHRGLCGRLKFIAKLCCSYDPFSSY